MRPAICLALVAPTVAMGQASLWRLGDTYRELVSRGVVGRPWNPRSNSAEGFPVNGEAKLPQPDSAIDPEMFYLKNADTSSRSGNLLRASGNVRFVFRGYEVTCDDAHGDLESEVFVLSGGVTLTAPDRRVLGDEVTINFKDKAYSFLRGSSTLGPGFLKNQVLGNLYMKGTRGSGTELQSLFESGLLTTCERDHPHYQLTSKTGDVKPRKRAILRDVRLTVLKRDILRLPYLIIPLVDYGERYLPEFGRSRDEGYFVRSKFGTPLKGDSWVDSRVDYYSRLGAGLGADLNYSVKNMFGQARLYKIFGPGKTELAGIDHRQKIFGAEWTLTGNFQRNNYLVAPNSEQFNARSVLLFRRRGETTRFSMTRTKNAAQNYSSISDTAALSDQRTIMGVRTNLDLNLVRSLALNSGTSASSRKQLDVRFRGTRELDYVTAALDYQRAIPVGSVQNFFNASDRTPVFSLATEARRFVNDQVAGYLPFRAEFSIGELKDSIRKINITRTHLDLGMGRTYRTSNRFQITYNSRIRQGIYSDDTAQYSLYGDLNARYEFGPRSTFGVRYNYLKPHGFTPLSIDRTGRAHEASFDLSYQPLPGLQFGAQTSYDIYRPNKTQVSWNTVGLRSEWTPNRNFQLRSQASYDPQTQLWSSLRFDLGMRAFGGFISAGARYDGTRHTWGTLNLLAEGLVFKRLKASVLLSFNGYTNKFDAKHFSFTYDMHCTEAILQILENPVGFRHGREIYFFIRIKALPFDTPFGIGQRGQAIGSGSGTGFGF